MDVAYFVNVGMRIAAGEVPYLDFPLPQAPLSFLSQAALIRLFGPSYPAQIAYVMVLGGLATGVTYAVTRRLLTGAVARPGLLALVLCVPLVPLGIYAVYPHPFYDPDACLAILAALAAVLAARHRPGPARWLLAGALLSLPFWVKQNIGGAFLAITIVTLAAEALARPQRRRALAWCLAGLAGAFALELVLLQSVVGIRNYVYWAFEYALSYRGLPAERLQAFVDAGVIWPGVVLVLLVLLSQRLTAPARAAAFTGASAATVIALALMPGAPLALRLFPPVLIATAVLALVRSVRDGPDFETTLPLILVVSTAGALMSQGLIGSTFGIFPLLVLAIASLVRQLARFVRVPSGVAPATGVVLAALLAASGLGYAAGAERLRYIDIGTGDVVRSSFPSLAGLSARGPYIADLDEVLFWAREHVRPDEPMVFLPGEDPAYFALGMPPRLPSVYFYDVGLPYTPAEIASIADDVGLRWVFVKDRLQLRDEPPLNQAVIAALTERATLVARVSAYRIYRR
ncbi:MAG TPA: hypothetical protein VFW12_11225 [Candidatus Limnocylindria bacterium]|nr:hypothetical protein [Candidatus Limnocylindria bacterium]